MRYICSTATVNMKFLFLVFAFFVAAQASVLDNSRMVMDKRVSMRDNHIFWTRQMNILRLFNHYKMENANTDQYTIAKNFKLETLLDMCEDKVAVKYFIVKYRDHLCIHKNQVFSITNKLHRDDVKLIVNIFHGIKDFDYFYEFACWVREYMNHDLFLYTMNVAILHRMDCRGMMIPPMYEIVPNKFFNEDVIEVAKRIKMQGGIFDVKDAENMGIKKVDDKTFLIHTFYSCWFLDTNKECKLNYYTEDVGLNNRYYLFHLLQPFWMYNDVHKSDLLNRRGEFFLYSHKQILTRYYLERLSNDMGEIPRFKYNLPITTGMTTTLKHSNGLLMPSRPNDFLVDTVDNLWDMKTVEDYERRLRDAIDRGFIVTEDGEKLFLNRPEDIELLGNIIQSNPDCPNRNFYLNGLLVAKHLLGNGLDTTNRMFTAPAIMEQYETALRDPMFWQLWKRIYHYVLKFKHNLRPYTYREVGLDGVTINDIKTEKLVTFFDTCDSDISNAVYRDMEEMKTNRDRFTFIARQRCLNHRRFNVNIDYTSDKDLDVMVKIFLGPKYDFRGIKKTLEEDFLQLDHFPMTLRTGHNTITRDSTKMCNGVKDMTYTAMMDKAEKCLTTGCDLDTKWRFNMPNRLILPKGKVGGMVFQLFVSVTPIKTTNVFNKFSVDSMNRMKSLYENFVLDDNAYGYPLDREIDWTVFTRCSNMLIKDVRIFHDADTDNVLLNTLMFQDYKETDFTTDKDFMYKNFMNKDMYTTKNFMDKDFVNREFMYKNFMDKDYVTRDFYNKDFYGKDFYTTNKFSKDFMRKNFMDKDYVTKDFYNKGFYGKDFYTTDKFNKDLMDKDYVTRDFYNKDFYGKDFYTTDKFNKDFMRKNFMDKDYVTKNFYNKDFYGKDFYTTDKFNKDFMRKNFMDKDYVTKDFYNKGFYGKDFYTTEKFNKDLMDKDYVTRDFYNKDFYGKDFYTTDKFNKDFMRKNFMDKDYVTKNFYNKDFYGKDFYTTDKFNKDFMTNKNHKNFMTDRFMDRSMDNTRFMDKFTTRDDSYEHRV